MTNIAPLSHAIVDLWHPLTKMLSKTNLFKFTSRHFRTLIYIAALLWHPHVHLRSSPPQYSSRTNSFHHLHMTPRGELITSHVQQFDIARPNYLRREPFSQYYDILLPTYDIPCLAYDFPRLNYSRNLLFSYTYYDILHPDYDMLCLSSWHPLPNYQANLFS